MANFVRLKPWESRIRTTLESVEVLFPKNWEREELEEVPFGIWFNSGTGMSTARPSRQKVVNDSETSDEEFLHLVINPVALISLGVATAEPEDAKEHKLADDSDMGTFPSDVPYDESEEDDEVGRNESDNLNASRSRCPK